MMKNNDRLIETDNFDFEFLSILAERESWRKEIHRPIYHLHKWWAKRLGSVFRGILLGTVLGKDKNLSDNFYLSHDFSDISVFDPFMGAGTTIGEAHKIGMTALGRDINPVAVESVRVALGHMDELGINEAFEKLSNTVEEKIKSQYKSKDSRGQKCDVLYYFWVMQASCIKCKQSVDLFTSWTIARNAYPNRKPEVQILCPSCGIIFAGINGVKEVTCKSCKTTFAPDQGNAKGSKATCSHCLQNFQIISTMGANKPRYRLYGKLVLTNDGNKEYLKTDKEDELFFEKSRKELKGEIEKGLIMLPNLNLEDGYNTKQAISYGFKSWTDFFNERQLLSLGWLHNAIVKIDDETVRDLFLLAFSSALEFNNMFASYKGEGTGAVRHMFSHHILKPERTPIEANVWGTSKSSGSFSKLFRNRIDRAIQYRKLPTEVNGSNGTKGIVSSRPFSGIVEKSWADKDIVLERKIYLSCDDSSRTNLTTESIDLIVTDPPFFDNVHYSELADFFYAWQKLVPHGFILNKKTTRSKEEVQDSNAANFSKKLQSVFQECNRVLKDDGLLVFTYHHSRNEGWQSVADALLNSGFTVVNSHPVKSEMSGATPKSQTNQPIQFDIVIVCRKRTKKSEVSSDLAIKKAREKINRLENAGFKLSKNDKKIIVYGQLLTLVNSSEDVSRLPGLATENNLY